MTAGIPGSVTNRHEKDAGLYVSIFLISWSKLSSPMINIFYVLSRLVPRGPIRVLHNIVSHLDRSRFRPVVCTISEESEDTMKPAFEDLEVPVRTLGLSRWEVLVRGDERLRKQAYESQADIVHTHGIRPDLLASRAFSDVDILATIHNYPYDDYVMKFGPVLGRAMAWTHLRVFRQVPHVAACSESIAGRVAQHGVGASVVRNGISTDDYRPADPNRRKAFRRRLGIAPDATAIVWVGALIKLKDPITMLDAYPSLQASSDVELFLLGDGELRSACEDRAASWENVQVEGHVDNVQQYLQAADLFVSTSTSEGLPNSVVEALATGCPVCLSDIDPHREILGLNAEAGALFKTGSAKSLAEASNKFIASDCSHQSRSARRLATDHLSARRMSAQYQRLYRRIVTSGKVPLTHE